MDNIVFFEGITSFRLIGQTRTAIREQINRQYKVFKKSRFSKNTTDDYGFLHVFYDENDICIAIEFFNECEIALNCTKIMNIKREAAKKLLLKADAELKEDEYGFVSQTFSLGISCPEDVVETIVVGKNGYYTQA